MAEKKNISRDRKFLSKEDHEQDYKKKPGRKKPYKTYKTKLYKEEALAKGLKDLKNGRTYMMSCNHKKEPLKVCWDCHVKDCKKWYKLGLSDGSKKSMKTIATITAKKILKTKPVVAS